MLHKADCNFAQLCHTARIVARGGGKGKWKFQGKIFAMELTNIKEDEGMKSEEVEVMIEVNTSKLHSYTIHMQQRNPGVFYL